MKVTHVAICGRISAGNRLTQKVVQVLGLESQIFHGTPALPYEHKHHRVSLRQSVEAFNQFTHGKTFSVLIPYRVELYRQASEDRSEIHGWLREMRRGFDGEAWTTEAMETKLTEAVSRTSPAFVHHVAYEDLVARPATTVRAICEGLGVRPHLPFESDYSWIYDGNAQYRKAEA